MKKAPPSSPRARDKDDLAALVIAALGTERRAWLAAKDSPACRRGLDQGGERGAAGTPTLDDRHLALCAECCARAWRGL